MKIIKLEKITAEIYLIIYEIRFLMFKKRKTIYMVCENEIKDINENVGKLSLTNNLIQLTNSFEND